MWLNKQQVHLVLESMPRNTPGMKLFDTFMVVLIILNVIAVIIGSVQSIEDQYGFALFLFEVFSVAIFTTELVLRFWVTAKDKDSGYRKAFWKNPYNWIDIVSILPFYLSLILTVDLRLFRLLRLIRIIRVSRYFRSMSLLTSVMKQEVKPMLSALVMILVLMLFSASGIYWLEKDIQPETFGNLPSSLWWVIVTLSTVGYGDAVPLTAMGKILGSVIMILGIGMVALPAGMLASRFSDMMHRQQEQFKLAVFKSLVSDNKDHFNKAFLEEKRQTLFIGKSEAESIIEVCIEEHNREVNYCPNCGLKIPHKKKI